jgi:hypothetical protein
MCFVSIFENRRMKSVEIVQRSGRRRGRMMEGVNLRYIGSSYVNVTMYPSIELLYVYKINFCGIGF